MTDEVRIKIKRLDPEIPLPANAHPGDAGIDLTSADDVTLKPGERALVPTGIAIAIPDGHAAYVLPRSGLAIRKGLGIVNAPGLIDSGYRGQVQVVAVNFDLHDPIDIKRGDRIAQMVILPAPKLIIEEVGELPESDRGTGGFGSTGG